MPTKPNLGDFVERDGKLYFIKAEKLTLASGKAGAAACSCGGFAYLVGYVTSFVLLLLMMCMVALFPVPLLAILTCAFILKV